MRSLTMTLRSVVLLGVGSLSVGVLAGFGPQQDGSGMSQLRELSRGILLYVSDADETFPIAMPKDPNMDRWLWNKSIEAPAGLLRDTKPDMTASNRAAWVNAVAPYWRSAVLLAIPDAPIAGWQPKLEDTVRDPWRVGFNYNGLLHIWRKESVIHPNLVPVIWTGQGFANRLGYATSSPTLWCDIVVPPPCIFASKPTGFATARATAFSQLGTAEVFDGAMALGMADGSAMRMLPSLSAEPNKDTLEPWATYAPDGKGMSFWVDKDGYPPLFRPDRLPRSDR